ncbi:heavy-metal-associated domain-containing protein [Crenobacter caeni]|uniref:Heavy-metal-associated domain-containing protein n=1 Tax=Crenobacter caeni TaxID=2705474 RepID=A0A6B2KNP4_9NEIS|nr:heavy-metal-associated domain-containing protein [Crenobacter caeni]NDV11784.1 heavy-metal-associated domain-containing protein [Crenobacter caeni]
MHQLHIDNIHCGGCVARVTRALQQLDENVRVEIDRTSGLAHIETTASLASVCEQLGKSGYPARSV